jgi:HEAT repeat protein
MATLRALAQLLEKSTLEKRFDAEDPTSFAKLHELAKNDASVRAELMKRYRLAPEGDAKEALQTLLANLHSPDVVAFSVELASKGASPAERTHGFELLSGLGLKLPEVRAVAKQAIETEKDPAVLSSAIASIKPSFSDDGEDADMRGRLQTFSRHTDPRVRTSAVGALAALDKTGESAGALEQALTDPAEEVRWAATSAIAENRIRSESIKETLLAIIGSPSENPGVKLSAARALERFALNPTEAAMVVNSAKAADRQLYGDADTFEPIQRDADQRW